MPLQVCVKADGGTGLSGSGDSCPPPRTAALTFQRTEEVEKGVIGDLLGDSSDGASALVLLFFLDGFDCNVLSFLPVNSAPTEARQPSTHTRQEKLMTQAGHKQTTALPGTGGSRSPCSRIHAPGAHLQVDRHGLPASPDRKHCLAPRACACQPRPAAPSLPRSLTKAPPEPLTCCPGQTPTPSPSAPAVPTQTPVLMATGQAGERKQAPTASTDDPCTPRQLLVPEGG